MKLNLKLLQWQLNIFVCTDVTERLDKVLKLTVDDISVPITRRPQKFYKGVVKPPSSEPETLQSPLVSLLNNNNIIIPSTANRIIGIS